MSIIAVDMDDVLFPFMSKFVPYYNETFSENFHIDDYWTFEFSDVWQIERHIAWTRVLDFMHQPHLDLEPVDGSVEAIDKLAEHYELVVVTSRENMIREHTENWINTHFPGRFSSIHLCNTYAKDRSIARMKSDVVEEMGAIALIDDSLRNVTEVAAKGRQGHLFGDFGWNRAETLPDGVIRHLSWNTIVERLAA